MVILIFGYFASRLPIREPLATSPATMSAFTNSVSCSCFARAPSSRAWNRLSWLVPVRSMAVVRLIVLGKADSSALAGFVHCPDVRRNECNDLKACYEDEGDLVGSYTISLHQQVSRDKLVTDHDLDGLLAANEDRDKEENGSCSPCEVFA